MKTTMTLMTRLAGALMLAGMLAPAASAGLIELADRELEDVTGQALLVADKLPGVSGSNHTFYRMALDAEIALNATIDRLQLGCGGFNEAVVANACDIDMEYVRLLGMDLSGGQPGASGSGVAATSAFTLRRPYFEFAIKNDADPTRRELIGFKVGAQTVTGFFSVGRHYAPGETTGCTSATSGSGAFYCHTGINRLSGYINAELSGKAYGCFNLFGCTPNPDPAKQDEVATIGPAVRTVWGTRMNRMQTDVPATSSDIGLTVDGSVNESLRFLHGFVLDPANTQYAADDFFLSFQREPVRYPTFNKSSTHSHTANPGWWLNVPNAELSGLKAYGVAVSAGSLGGVTLTDPDIGQRPVDNCFGALKFC